MPHSLSLVYLHLVFSTKDRRPQLRDPTLRSDAHAYLSGVSKTLDCPALIVGGVEDHVHILAHFGRLQSQAQWVKELKRVSSIWMRQQSSTTSNFSWQNGYAIFSVSHSNVPKVKRYIQDQEYHHRKMTFQDELRRLLEKHQAQWDERYLWG